ncbi:60 kDa SS-A/Ro ribonucleoprotein-like protein [Hyaloraphidium curvatum]|nr:60 kDa SS-A/Ro ribonucleoprotein-like protein [Hyaloraphidium curvatum]KAI9026311.1 60 kDa SS-A/Ro ribonucleoprotein-like protein [Hyaloraphidium curvatum]
MPRRARNSYLSAAMAPQPAVPQSKPLPGREMVENNAGGFVFAASDQAKLERFLVLGTEKGSYYATEKALTVLSANHLVAMIASGRGKDVVATVADFSLRSRTPKQDTLVFALAAAIKLGDDDTRAAAYAAVPQVCRIPTTLFQLFEFEKLFGDKKPTWGAGMRRAVAGWYLGKPAMDLAYTTSKYKSRNDWTSRDVLRCVHLKVPGGADENRPAAQPEAAVAPETAAQPETGKTAKRLQTPAKPLPPIASARDLVLRYIVRGRDGVKGELERILASSDDMDTDAPPPPAPIADDDDFEMVPMPASEAPAGNASTPAPAKDAAELRRVAAFISALEDMAALGLKQGEPADEDVARAAELIRRFRLAREHVPTSFLNSPEIWRALLAIGMPMTAMIRNLGKMTSVGLLEPLSDESDSVCRALASRDAIRKARVHPFSILLAMETYRAGRGVRGSLSWDPDERIVDSLSAAFDLAFENVEPTGKKFLVGIDVSGSMSSPIAGSSISSRTAASAIALALVRSEQQVHTMAFCDTFTPFPIGKHERLDAVVDRSDGMPFGGTDCALPMTYALEKRLEVDVFVVLTDNETWFGRIHPSEALRRYRAGMGRPHAKLAVAAFAVNDFTIADPEDLGMLDIVGLDASIPVVLRDFVLREG